MPAASVTYRFRQRFRVPARAAYRWCTDYRADDLLLMNEKGKREIQRISDDTIVLTETIHHNRRRIRKIKLVKLDSRTLSWHNIHLSGPNVHSEFLYRVTPEGQKRSRLTFVAHLVSYAKKRPSSKSLRHIAEEERRYDSEAWKRLAKAMQRDLRVKPLAH